MFFAINKVTDRRCYLLHNLSHFCLHQHVSTLNKCAVRIVSTLYHHLFLKYKQIQKQDKLKLKLEIYRSFVFTNISSPSEQYIVFFLLWIGNFFSYLKHKNKGFFFFSELEEGIVHHCLPLDCINDLPLNQLQEQYCFWS